MNSTRSEIIGDTVELFSNHTKIQFMYSSDRASLDATYLTESLLHPNHEALFIKFVETQLAALRQLSNLFQARLNRPCAPLWVVHISASRIVEDTAPPRVDTPEPPIL